MKILLKVILIILFCFVICVVGMVVKCSSDITANGYGQRWNEGLGTAYLNLSYGNEATNTYDLFVPKNVTKNDSMAVMLFIHGGSWLGGDKQEMEYACCQAASRGYISATMNYSVLEEGKDVSMQTMLKEITQCIKHIEQQSAKLGYSVRQISIGGTSAGAHLAMLYAYTQRETSPLPIRFVISQVGPTDFFKLFPIDTLKLRMASQNGVNTPEYLEFSRLAHNITGHTPQPQQLSCSYMDSIYHTISPLYQVDRLSAPTLMAYGGKDWLIIPQHMQAMASRLDSLAVDNETFLFPDSDHSLMGNPEDMKRFQNAVSEYCKKYFGY